MAGTRFRSRDVVRWLLLLGSAGTLCAAEIVGTDLLAGGVSAAMARALGREWADFAGSLPGRQAFTEGRAGGVVLLLREGELPPVRAAEGPAESFRVGAAVVVVATHPANPILQLTRENLANAFAKDARAPARNWNDLDAQARSELITPAVCSPPGTLSLEIFQGLVLDGQPFRLDVRQRIEPDLAADLLASRAGTVVLLARPPEGRGRLIPIADGRAGKSATAYLPEAENVHNGDYPLQLPLVLFVAPKQVAALRPALRWLFSDEAAALLEKQGLYPAPPAARQRALQRLDSR